MSNGDITSCPKEADASDVVKQNYVESTDNDDARLALKIYGKCKIIIYKPLLLLKLVMFMWYGAGGSIGAFINVYFKQRGLTLNELSLILFIAPAAQFSGTAISGIIADKIGRTKPVLLAHLFLSIIIVVCTFFVPHMNNMNCTTQEVNLKCHKEEFNRLLAKSACGIQGDVLGLESCHVDCPENVTQPCAKTNFICEILAIRQISSNFSLSVHVNETWSKDKLCYYNIVSMSYENISYSWCDVPHKLYCRITCKLPAKCPDESGNRIYYFIGNMIVLLLFLTCFTIIYRMFDVISMTLVKTHDADLGRQRFWANVGVLVLAPISGYIVQVSSGSSQLFYEAAYYVYIVMCLVTIIIIWKMKVPTNPPGKRMWKKTLSLLRNPDAVLFVLVLFTMGTMWGFIKLYVPIHIESLKASSVLLSLIPAASSFYGLPFLFTSNWWVQKIGSTNIFLLALLGYAVSGIGYAYVHDPWFVLLFEMSGVVSYHLLWVAVVIYSHDLAPDGLVATVISTAGALHFGVGKACGSFAGGRLVSYYGGRRTFMITSIYCIIAAVMYGSYLRIRQFCCRKQNSINDISGIEEMSDFPNTVFTFQDQSMNFEKQR